MTNDTLDLSRMTLNEVDAAWNAGRVPDDAVRAWLAEWNATPCRFTVAVLTASGIRNRVRGD